MQYVDDHWIDMAHDGERRGVVCGGQRHEARGSIDHALRSPRRAGRTYAECALDRSLAIDEAEEAGVVVSPRAIVDRLSIA
jgi:hypothetical protein